jgi:DNA-binding CsgD family transcriptional regulator
VTGGVRGTHGTIVAQRSDIDREDADASTSLPGAVPAMSTMAAVTDAPRIDTRPLADLAWGTHLCMFFQTPDDLVEALVPYFREGLERHEYCVWVVSGRLSRKRGLTALRQVMPDLARYLAEGSLEIIPAREWYLQGGRRLDFRRVIRGWHQRLRQAEARGYAGLRVAGTAAWLQTRTEWNDFLEYEAALNDAMRNRRIIVLCSYQLGMSRAADVLDVARSHHAALVRRDGAWQTVVWRDVSGSPGRHAPLTPRERQVLRLVAEGSRNSDIAGQLSISARTVEVHRTNLARKLGLRTRAGLVRYALQHEL